jgi:phosphoglycerate dehydrogenase-like enzyme
MAEFVVCATSPVPDQVVDAAAEFGVRFVTLDPLEPDEVARQLAEHQPQGYLLAWPDLGPYVTTRLADAAGGLRLVTYCGQSPEPAFYTDNLDVEGLRERGIVLTTTSGAEFAVAESALGFILAFELGLVAANAARRRDPEADPSVVRRRGLVGSTLGIVGMGRIGRRVGELASACGMEIRYFSRTRRPDVEEQLGASFQPLRELFASCDHVSLHVPMGPGEGLIGAEVLSCADGITLINTTSIATVVDAEALLLALERGWVARFGLEGRYPEPYDERLRAYGDDRVLLMPPYSSYDTPYGERIGWARYLETLTALLRGGDVPHQLLGSTGSDRA